MKWKNILLDFDGTLIDSAPGVFASLEYTFEKLGVPCPPRQELTWCIGPGVVAIFERLFPDESPEWRSAAIHIMRDHYEHEGYKQTTLFPGVPEFLQRLPGMGYRVYLTTMKAREGTEAIVRMFGIERYFTGIHAYEMGGGVQIKEDLLRQVLEREHLDPPDTVVVGDTLHDVNAAGKNGLSIVAVSYGYVSFDALKDAGVEYVARSVDELTAVLEEAAVDNPVTGTCTPG